MRVYEFKELRKEILKNQGIKDVESLKVETIKFKSKIAEGDNIEKFDKLLKNHQGEEILMVSGTGTGKTYMVSKYMDSLYLSETKSHVKHRIQLIAVPSTAQARQLKTYGFQVLVGGENLKEFDLRMRASGASEGNVKIAFVYDKADTILKFMEKHPHDMIDLFVDEAHKLYTAYSYRDAAIDVIEKLLNMVRRRKGNVVLMTATPRSLAFRKELKLVIEFKGEEQIAKYNQIEIICKNNDSDKVQDMVYSTIIHENKAGNRCFVRYNSFEDTGNITAKLREVNNLDVKVVSSKNKDYIMAKDAEGNYYNKYENPIFNCFVNKSSLPLADVWFTTSMLDEGGSINQIEKIGQSENLVAIFVVKNKKFMQLDDLLQFSARIRFPYKKLIVIVNRKEENTEESGEKDAKRKNNISKMESLCWYITKEIKLTKEIIQSYAKLMGLKGASAYQMREELESFTKLENLAGFQNNMCCITIGSEAEIVVNEKKQALTIYNVYNNQFAENINEFAEQLKKETDCTHVSVKPVDIIDCTYNEDYYLEEILYDEDLAHQVYNNYLKEDELIILSHTKKYKDVQILVNMQKTIYGARRTEKKVVEIAVKAVLNNTIESLKTRMLSELLKNIEDNELKDMCGRHYDGNYTKSRKILEENGAFELIKGLKGLCGDIDQSIMKFRKFDGDIGAAKKYIKENMVPYMNELYEVDRDKLWCMDKAGRAHVIILDHIRELNSKGNVKKKTINNTILDEVVEALNKEFGEQAYSRIKVRHLIDKMVVYQDDNKIAYFKRVKW